MIINLILKKNIYFTTANFKWQSTTTTLAELCIFLRKIKQKLHVSYSRRRASEKAEVDKRSTETNTSGAYTRFKHSLFNHHYFAQTWQQSA